MPDFYPVAKHLSDYVDEVIGHLSKTMSVEAASLRVLEHLRTVLIGGFEGTRADDMAFVLTKPEHSA
jgi:hypothetical protein